MLRAVTLFALSALPVVALAGPLHHWTGNDTLADDIAGVDATVGTGTVAYATGMVDQSFSFDGATWLTMTTDASLTGDEAAWGEAWIKTSDTYGVIVQQRSKVNYIGEWILSVGWFYPAGGVSGHLCFWDYGDLSTGGIGVGTHFCGDTWVADGAWHHVAFERGVDGTTNLYVDGVLDGTATGGVVTYEPTSLAIGGDQRDGMRFYTGLIDEVIIGEGLRDADGDGVPDVSDSCPETAEGAVVDDLGCSIADYCPCEADWKTHGKYQQCVRDTARDFADDGLISRYEAVRLHTEAAASDCGK